MTEISIQEEEILKDSSISPVCEEFSYDTALKNINQWLNQLKHVKEPAEIIESENYARSLLNLAMISSSSIVDQSVVCDQYHQENRYRPVVDFYIWILKNYRILDLNRTKKNPPNFYCYNRMTQNEIKLLLLTKLALCVNSLFVSLIDIRKYSIKQDILTPLIQIMDDEQFLDQINTFDKDFITVLAFNINWLSKIADSYKEIWHSLNAINVLIKASKKFTNISLYLYMATANIAYDKEIEDLTDIHQVIDVFVELTNQGVSDERKHIIKQEFIDEDDNQIYEFEVRSIYDEKNNATISITGLLLSLYRLSVNNKIKYELYQKPNLKESLKQLIVIGNDIERFFTIQLMAQLSFDERVNEEMSQDSELIAHVESILIKKSEIIYRKLLKVCQQFIWLLSEIKVESETKKEESNDHIMISYNTASRELCLRIKEKMEEAGLKVWIDVDEIHGSSLDSMAKAVENSKCVLMCVTEKYRQSVNCQSEAQYAFRLNKKIIPLIMQKGYGNVDGWLGIIIGDKIFIDFTKYDFQNCMKRLFKQINLLNKNNPPIAQMARVQGLKQAVPDQTYDDNDTTLLSKINSLGILSSIDEPANKSLSYEAEDWSEEKVKEWLNLSGLDLIYEFLKPLNGKILNQLYLIQQHTPEFFYKSIVKNESVDLKSIALFSSLLKELFS